MLKELNILEDYLLAFWNTVTSKTDSLKKKKDKKLNDKVNKILAEK